MFADHHAGAHQRCHRRPRQVPHLGHLRRPLGHDRLLPGRALGLRLRQHRRGRLAAAGWLAKRGRRGLRRWYRGPHQRRCRRPRARHRPRQAHRLAKKTRCVRTTSRSSCSVPACCGSAGSASTPARRSVPTSTAALAFMNTQVATAAALARLAARREDPRRSPDQPRCRVRCRRRPRRHHPGVCVHRSRGPRSCSASLAGAICCPRGRPEVQAQLRRLARRRGRPPRRRHRRLPVHRLLRHQRGRTRLGLDGLFYGGGCELLGKQALGVGLGAARTRSS